MKCLTEEHERAIGLRRLGKSIGEISSIMGRPKSSISVWVRGVELKKEHKARLVSMNPIKNYSYERVKQGAKANADRCREIRKEYQEQGKLLLKHGTDFVAGIMLFWAEGSKSRNQLRFSNTDPNMLGFFVKFLRRFFEIDIGEVTLSVSCYLNNGLSLKDIEDFWIETLSLHGAKIGKAQVLGKRKTSGIKKNIHVYGICQICVCRTDIVQKIKGAIQGYIGLDSEAWLDK